MMPAGLLKHKVSIQRHVVTRDEMGGVVSEWSTLYANLPAQVEDYSGREKFHAESEREITYTIKTARIRYIDGLTTKDRVLYAGKAYDILKVEDNIDFRESVRITMQLAK